MLSNNEKIATTPKKAAGIRRRRNCGSGHSLFMIRTTNQIKPKAMAAKTVDAAANKIRLQAGFLLRQHEKILTSKHELFRGKRD
jgi:hypothetical protein